MGVALNFERGGVAGPARWATQIASGLVALGLGACTSTEVLGTYPTGTDDGTAAPAGNRDGGTRSDAPSGATQHRGRVLLAEGFDDDAFAERGWYDGPGGTLSPSAVSGLAFECDMSGSAPCERPGRVPFEEQESLYVSFWLRFSEGYRLQEEVGQLFLLTNADRDLIGPAISQLTIYLLQSEGKPQVGVLDSANVDPNCVLLSTGEFQGCDGDADSYVFGEERSVNACNGIQGNPTYTTCSPNDFGGFYSFRGFESDSVGFGEPGSSSSKTDWHFVEFVVELNSVQDGVGQEDGRLRYWLDGRAMIEAADLILRTGEHPDMRFQHVLLAPVALDSEEPQLLWMDELVIAEGQP